jgi:hypothetical protein
MNLSQGLTLSKIIMLLLVLSGFASNSTDKAKNYPIEPEFLGSNKVKWAQTSTPDGWTMVTWEVSLIVRSLHIFLFHFAIVPTQQIQNLFDRNL